MAASEQVKQHAKPPARTLWRRLLFLVQILISVAIVALVVVKLGSLSKLLLQNDSGKQSKFVPPKEGAWRFVVSGDSRNCGKTRKLVRSDKQDVPDPTTARIPKDLYEEAMKVIDDGSVGIRSLNDLIVSSLRWFLASPPATA